MSNFQVIKEVSTLMSLNRVKEIANFLLKHHKPKPYNYSRKYPMNNDKKLNNLTSIKPMQVHIKESVLTNPNVISNHDTDSPLCSKCKSPNIEIRYGKYSYYFKCLFCQGNTAITLKCTNSTCKPKLKKSKLHFNQICEVCGKNELFFKNPEKLSEEAVS
jgi:hypothetical protein